MVLSVTSATVIGFSIFSVKPFVARGESEEIVREKEEFARGKLGFLAISTGNFKFQEQIWTKFTLIFPEIVRKKCP